MAQAKSVMLKLKYIQSTSKSISAWVEIIRFMSGQHRNNAQIFILIFLYTSKTGNKSFGST